MEFRSWVEGRLTGFLIKIFYVSKPNITWIVGFRCGADWFMYVVESLNPTTTDGCIFGAYDLWLNARISISAFNEPNLVAQERHPTRYEDYLSWEIKVIDLAIWKPFWSQKSRDFLSHGGGKIKKVLGILIIFFLQPDLIAERNFSRGRIRCL